MINCISIIIIIIKMTHARGAPGAQQLRYHKTVP